MLLKYIPILLLLSFVGCASPEPLLVTTDRTLAPNDRLPKMLRRVDPIYPYEVKKAGIEGTVIVDFFIDRDGRVSRAKAVESPDPRLSASAEIAVRSFKFEPALKNGVPTACRMQVPITFSIIKSE